MADIAENIRNIRSRIDAAAQKAGRDPDSILLLAVTKLHEAEEINGIRTYHQSLQKKRTGGEAKISHPIRNQLSHLCTADL
ncbi:MAG: hypothetical protein HUJ80_03240, partial [Firmicutes bacterium]|nr:hypothetical protein [Bacillota bacterium]